MRPLFVLLYQPQMIDDDDHGTIGGILICKGNRITRRKSTPGLLSSPQILHDVTLPRTRTAFLGNLRLIASAMARPYAEYENALCRQVFWRAWAHKLQFRSVASLLRKICLRCRLHCDQRRGFNMITSSPGHHLVDIYEQFFQVKLALFITHPFFLTHRARLLCLQVVSTRDNQ
jgi:hypothetical protein